MNKIAQQIAFLTEIDKLKLVLRRAHLMDGSRFENTAEHSWHATLMAVVMFEHAADSHLDLLKVIKMLLLHDIVEIDAGDTYGYDAAADADKHQREHAAAERIFGLLPVEQNQAFMALWQEFDAEQTAEARFASAIDRVAPIMHNYYNQGGSWVQHDISIAQVRARIKLIYETAPKLGEFYETILQKSLANGWLFE